MLNLDEAFRDKASSLESSSEVSVKSIKGDFTASLKGPLRQIIRMKDSIKYVFRRFHLHMNVKDNLNKFNKIRTFTERSLGVNLRMDTDFISGSLTLNSRVWTLDDCLWTLELCSLFVDYGHVDSGFWTLVSQGY